MEKQPPQREKETIASATPSAEELKQIIKTQRQNGTLKNLPRDLSLKTEEEREKRAEWLAKNEERQNYIDHLIKKGVINSDQAKKDRRDTDPEFVLEILHYEEGVYDFNKIMDEIFKEAEEKAGATKLGKYITITKNSIIDTVIYPENTERTNSLEEETMRIQRYLKIYEKIATNCKNNIITVSDLSLHSRDTPEKLEAWETLVTKRYKLAELCRKEKSVPETSIRFALTGSNPQNDIEDLGI